jgi:hypothetical protein
VQALISVGSDFGGAVLRDAPNGTIIISLFNGSLVQILGEFQTDASGLVWARVLDLENNVEGWIRQTLLITATPPPGAVQPSNTAVVSPTAPASSATPTP